MALKRLLVWGDVAFYLGVLVVGVRVAPHTAAWFGGITIAALAFPRWVLARLQLGASFSFTPQARALVTSGLYSRVRHPVYVFGTLSGLSALLVLQIWPLFVIGVALIPVTILRARREERLLAATFGADYENYRKATWF